MGEQELDVCSCCGKKTVVMRKYYHYSVDCDCCNGDTHFEIVKHCENCTPRPPARARIILDIKPIDAVKNDDDGEV